MLRVDRNDIIRQVRVSWLHLSRVHGALGHLAGDYVLRELSSIVAQNIRREDVFARYGGEEFALVLPEIEGESAAQVCEKLRAKIEEKHFSFAQKRINVTVSLGIRAVRKDEQDISHTEFIAQADAKLYQAKQSGRNRVCM